MNKSKKIMSFILFSIFSVYSIADNNPISVHVLNLQTGLPSSGIEVKLEQKINNHWKLINIGVTDVQGRITELYPKKQDLVKNTIYKVTFETGKWFEANKTETFFPEIPVIFTTNGNLEHYHIPLLLSPYGYSTYRGN